MSRLSPAAGMALEWTFLVIALVFVLLRIYVRVFLQKIFRYADLVILLAWILFMLGNVTDTLCYKAGLWDAHIIFTADKPPNLEEFFPDKRHLEYILKTLYVSAIPYYSSLWCVKLAFILLYFQIIPKTMVRMRRALWFTTGFVVVGFVCMICLNLFYCTPISRNWATDIGDNCYAYASIPPYFVTLAFHLLSDFLIYGLPFFLFPVLKKINGNTRKDLYGLAAVFSLGGLCIVCTICRTAVNGVNAWLPTISAWSTAEMCVAVVVACCPPLKLLWLGFTTYGMRRGSLANVGNEVEYGRRQDAGDVEDQKPEKVEIEENEKMKVMIHVGSKKEAPPLAQPEPSEDITEDATRGGTYR